jgi:transcription antitermination factor NusG
VTAPDDQRRAASPRPIAINHDVVAHATAASDPGLLAEPSTTPAQWHLLRVQLHQESVATAHLVARRFGAYLPTFRTLERAGNGRRREVRRPIFPGYVFIFVWGLERHLRRIRACPGVIDIERFAGSVVVPDYAVDLVQLIEARLDGYRGNRKRRGWRKRALTDALEPDDRLTIATKSRLIGVADLDDAGRQSLLLELLASPIPVGRGRRPELVD